VASFAVVLLNLEIVSNAASSPKTRFLAACPSVVGYSEFGDGNPTMVTTTDEALARSVADRVGLKELVFDPVSPMAIPVSTGSKATVRPNNLSPFSYSNLSDRLTVRAKARSTLRLIPEQTYVSLQQWFNGSWKVVGSAVVRVFDPSTCETVWFDPGANPRTPVSDGPVFGDKSKGDGPWYRITLPSTLPAGSYRFKFVWAGEEVSSRTILLTNRSPG
jgi:hypothetical protein